MDDRTCTQCGRVFRPSSRHAKCPSCRSRSAKTPCVECGEPSHKDHKHCRSCEKRGGDSNGNWRGGKTVHRRGYTMRYVPDHPRLAGRSGQYVFEHILVMEDMLGRFLVDGENVHHKNGVKDDNRPENLELWTRPQPSGARASDLVEWAVEILGRYAPDRLN